ncbi:MAG: hypothetical protein PHS79_00015 [Patescibacteria group bacterium]|nr:hypothetical protein [Patescibacteria group bacterium]
MRFLLAMLAMSFSVVVAIFTARWIGNEMLSVTECIILGQIAIVAFFVTELHQRLDKIVKILEAGRLPDFKSQTLSVDVTAKPTEKKE